jgi:diguanylate cyclase (GGDEF)-like protein
MRIRDSAGLSTSTPAGRITGPAKAGKAPPAGPVGEPRDVATLVGIPEAELTPKVRHAIAQLMAEVQSLREQVDRLKNRTRHLEQLADQDTLAPVLNRRAFVRELSRNAAFAERYGAVISVIYFDINGMKEVNDLLGHAAGDLALRHVAEVLVGNVRASDVVGRLGGDEFGVILSQSDEASAKKKAQILAAAIAGDGLEYKDQGFRIGVAYGVHTLAAGDQVDDALEAADKAMYAHKKAAAGKL